MQESLPDISRTFMSLQNVRKKIRPEIRIKGKKICGCSSLTTNIGITNSKETHGHDIERKSGIGVKGYGQQDRGYGREGATTRSVLLICCWQVVKYICLYPCLPLPMGHFCKHKFSNDFTHISTLYENPVNLVPRNTKFWGQSLNWQFWNMFLCSNSAVNLARIPRYYVILIESSGVLVFGYLP